MKKTYTEKENFIKEILFSSINALNLLDLHRTDLGLHPHQMAKDALDLGEAFWDEWQKFLRHEDERRMEKRRLSKIEADVLDN